MTGRLTGTPGVLGRLLEAERVARQTVRTVGQLRGKVLHAFLIPTIHDVAAMRRELKKVHSSLTDMEARRDKAADRGRVE